MCGVSQNVGHCLKTLRQWVIHLTAEVSIGLKAYT